MEPKLIAMCLENIHSSKGPATIKEEYFLFSPGHLYSCKLMDVELLTFAGHCVLIDINAVHAVDCKSKRNFFCQREGEGEINCAMKQLSWQEAVNYCKANQRSLIQSVTVPENEQRLCTGRSAGLWIGAELTRKTKLYGLNSEPRDIPQTFNSKCPEDGSNTKTKCGLFRNIGGQPTCTQVACQEKHPYLCYTPKTSYTGAETRPAISPIAPVVAKENSSASMFCNVTGITAPESYDYSWFFKGIPVAHGATLQLDRLRRMQSGEYTCTVSIRSHKTQRILSASRQTTLTVQYLHLRAKNESIRVTEGDPFEITCIADGVPKTIQFFPWTHRDRLEGKHLIGRAMHTHISSYQVAKASYKDTGIYICYAQNAVDKKQASTRVTVLFSPKSDTHPDSTKGIYSALFKDVTLEIKVFAYPTNVKFTWYQQKINSRDSFEITSKDGKFVTKSDKLESSLTIVNATVADFTNYSVRADNGVSKESYFYFSVILAGEPGLQNFGIGYLGLAASFITILIIVIAAIFIGEKKVSEERIPTVDQEAVQTQQTQGHD